MIAKELYERYIGLTLLHDLENEEGTLLLKKGTVLSESVLKRLNIPVERLVYTLTRSSTKHEQVHLMEGAAEEIKTIFQNFQKDKNTLTQIESTVLPTVEHLAREEKLSILLVGMHDKDDYTYRHNIGVAIVASMLARWLKYSEEEIELITLGGLLHDIGKLHVSDYVLTKPGALTNEEYKAIQMHTTFGYDILIFGFAHLLCICASSQSTKFS